MDIAKKIISWQKVHGRHDLPWQQNINSYRVWVSEIMLQQTQVKTVIPYYERFMENFPTLKHLASAEEDDVIPFWAGLGYYQRCRNLHMTSRTIISDYAGKFPDTPEKLIALPGIGKSTAHAILSIVHNHSYAILDGNVKRVLARVFGIHEPINQASTIKKLWNIAETVVPKNECRIFTQGIMDLGAHICNKAPTCSHCPLSDECLSKKHNLQGEIPQKIKKTKKPLRTWQCVCYFVEDKIFLQQRDNNGIWPKLWTPIILEQSTYPETTQDYFSLKVIKHSFTHFNLVLTPIIILGNPPKNMAGTWHTKASALSLGIPAPVKKLIILKKVFEAAIAQTTSTDHR